MATQGLLHVSFSRQVVGTSGEVGPPPGRAQLGWSHGGTGGEALAAFSQKRRGDKTVSTVSCSSQTCLQREVLAKNLRFPLPVLFFMSTVLQGPECSRAEDVKATLCQGETRRWRGWCERLGPQLHI